MNLKVVRFVWVFTILQFNFFHLSDELVSSLQTSADEPESNQLIN